MHDRIDLFLSDATASRTMVHHRELCALFFEGFEGLGCRVGGDHPGLSWPLGFVNPPELLILLAADLLAWAETSPKCSMTLYK